jgi:hypothetical protein
MTRHSLAAFACVLLTLRGAFGAEYPSDLINGCFEDGLKAWRVEGDVTLEKGAPIEGKASLRIGPGAGSVSQRVRTGNGDHLSISIAVKSDPANTAILIVRFLDDKGQELMRLNSSTDIKPGDKVKPGMISFYMKEHPLTADVEVILSKANMGGYVLGDQIEFAASKDNEPGLKPACDLDQYMQPFWQGKRFITKPC